MAATKAAAVRAAERDQEAATRVSPGLAEYQVLSNVSVPQRTEAGILTGQNDLAVPGEVVKLTETEARNLMKTGPRAGRRTPAIRPADLKNEPLVRIHPRLMSGSLRAPVMPDPGTDGPRPDPAGASKLMVREPVIPEALDPQPGSEATGGQDTGQGPLVVDAIDIVPGTARVGV